MAYDPNNPSPYAYLHTGVTTVPKQKSLAREIVENAGLPRPIGFRYRDVPNELDVLYASAILTSGQISTLAGAVLAHDPTNRDEYNRNEFLRIDDHAKAKILRAGFLEGGVWFSSSETAQLKWLFMATNIGDLNYPREVRSRNNKVAVTLATATDVKAHFNALRVAIQGEHEAASTAKQAVIDAANEAAATAAANAYLGT
jgi:hypothetical protein